MNNALMNMDVQLSESLLSFLLGVTRSGIAGSYGSSMFNFWRHRYILLTQSLTSSLFSGWWQPVVAWTFMGAVDEQSA